MLPVLAISGKRFAGKDTFAGLLVRRAHALGYAVPTHAFADASKRLFVTAQRVLGIDVELERLLRERSYKERWRPALTAFTVAALARDPLVFCREVADRIAADGVPALVTDLRLRDEHVHLGARFALQVVRLHRSDASREASGWTWRAGVDDHHTECELDDPTLWHEVVDNSGSLAELDEAASATLATFLRAVAAPRSDR